MIQENTTTPSAKKMLDRVREKIRYKHYSLSTERTYISWIKHYIIFNGKRHPLDMGAVEMERFLTVLANRALKNYLRCWCGVKNRLKVLIY